MAKKVSAGAQLKLDTLEEARRKTERIASLVEQYAAAKGSQAEQFLMSIARTATDVGRVLMMNGFGVMADSCNQIKMLAKRGGTQRAKARSLRELIGGVESALERAVKGVKAKDAEGAAEAGEH